MLCKEELNSFIDGVSTARSYLSVSSEDPWGIPSFEVDVEREEVCAIRAPESLGTLNLGQGKLVLHTLHKHNNHCLLKLVNVYSSVGTVSTGQ